MDPDGYRIEIIKRSASATVKGVPTFQQSMIRIKDPEKSLAFYKDLMQMTLMAQLDFPEWKFSLYFMASMTKEQADALPPIGTPER